MFLIISFSGHSGIASILFETRIGCLEKEIPAGTQDFINAIAQMFSNSFAVLLAPKWSRNLLPYWGRYIAGWEGIFSFGELKREMVDRDMQLKLTVTGLSYCRQMLIPLFLPV